MVGNAKKLKISNARENNLKSVSIDIKHDALTVVTGLSGSGKSSLAFDTVYAEGQRRYIETFSPYVRQFLDKVKKPDVDLIENVRPAIAIQQRTRILSSRSTVGSMTDCNDYLKILWSTIGVPHCPECGVRLRSWNVKSTTDQIVKLQGIRKADVLLICAPVPATSKSGFNAEIKRLTETGFSRFYDPIVGTICNVDSGAKPSWLAGIPLLVAVTRIRGSDANSKSLREAIDSALSLTRSLYPLGGTVWLVDPARSSARAIRALVPSGDEAALRNKLGVVATFHERIGCEYSKTAITPPRQSLFSFNHPLGACPECKGFGRILKIDPARCVPNHNLSIADGAVQCWASESTEWEFGRLKSFCKSQDIDVKVPWHKLRAEDTKKIFEHKSKDYRGIFHWFKALERKAYKMHVRVYLSKFRTQVECPTCDGTRLTKSALAYRIAGRTLPEIWKMPVEDLKTWLESIEAYSTFNESSNKEVSELISALSSRIGYLCNLGLPYLTLDRQARTLSGGETQRVNLTTALGSELISSHFVLDEPSVGLHARDTDKLIGAVRALQQRGNSLLVVEHDLACIESADEIIEMGPAAGTGGGETVYSGPANRWHGIEISPIKFPDSTIAPKSTSKTKLSILNACARNLKGFALDIPLHKLVCITGVSGSGKSTLVHEVLKRAYEERNFGTSTDDSPKVAGLDLIDELLVVDQSPIAKSPRGNIATYCGIWDSVRDLFSATDGALLRGLTRSSFSFNVDGGRCPACDGAGFIREDMQFLSDVYIPCELCLGKRFQQTVLEVQYASKNIDEVLKLSVDEAITFFKDERKIQSSCSTLSALGLGHLTLGHPLSELSGGEAQRLKLVPFVEQSSASKHALLIFDEPTTGLHHYDVERLIGLLRELTNRGHSVLVVEHNLSLIVQCDWVVDLGPEGGSKGGELLRAGTPKQICESHLDAPFSYTARYLNEYVSAANRKKTPSSSSTSVTKKVYEELAPTDHLIIRGAREHNLKNIDLNIPLGATVALTGVSGSGKSTLAKDIIYAEGQRRYLDCLSPYARQFIKELKRPNIQEISGIQPTICVYQHTFQPSRLSTIGTMSEVYNYLRLLLSKVGTQYCPDHPKERISPLSAEEIARQLLELKDQSVRLLAPIIKKKKGHHRAVLERAVQSEITQVRVDGVFLSPSTVSMSGGLERTKAHTIEFVIAKFNPATIGRELLRDAINQALSLSGGEVVVVTARGESVLSTERACPVCKQGFFKPDPEDLSFSSRRGACASCSGTGESASGGICSKCGGTRLGPLGRNVRIADRNIYELSSLVAPELLDFLTGLNLDKRSTKIAEAVLREVTSRLKSLIEIKLDYLPLTRSCSTLSGGELQRLRLSSAMGSPLSGVMYIFDEPSAGLHPHDNERVLAKLHDLKARGNSVIMIEHELQSILAAEHIIEIGPGGGRRGGEVVFEGTASTLKKTGKSATADALRSPIFLASGNRAKQACEALPHLKLTGGNRNNINSLDCEIPLQSLITVCGVSGAGKSTLVRGIIAATMNESGFSTSGSKKFSSDWGNLISAIDLARIIEVDQSPIGATSRSTPASYLGIWDQVRVLFAATPEARARGWTASFFSYNTGKGRCQVCGGQGRIKLEMNFLPDAFVECDSCQGMRFGDDARSIRYLNLSPSEVLQLTFEEALPVFVNHRKIHEPVRLACELGLGYLTLGQNSATLSGGESQRLKLVSELAAPRRGHTIYILDEPTTGLHRQDVAKLLTCLRKLVELNHTVVLIEHDADAVFGSDYLIEMGPGPGEQGGHIVFQGPPEELRNSRTPWGQIMRQEFRESSTVRSENITTGAVS